MHKLATWGVVGNIYVKFQQQLAIQVWKFSLCGSRHHHHPGDFSNNYLSFDVHYVVMTFFFMIEHDEFGQVNWLRTPLRSFSHNFSQVLAHFREVSPCFTHQTPAAAAPRCSFCFTMSLFLANLLVVQLVHTYHEAHINMKARKVKRNIENHGDVTCERMRNMGMCVSLGL